MEPNKPNLFKIATTELSQDGFFTWLIQWADNENAQHNQELHEIAQKFVRFLLGEKDDFSITKVKARRQVEHIDIWAEIDEDFLVIIEDKTYTGERQNQLKTYKDIAQDWCRENNRQHLICIYLKTGSEARYLRKEIEDKGYIYIDRAKLLNFFKEYKTHVHNDIYYDFVDRINEIEYSEKHYKEKDIGEWDENNWKGFYQYLDEASLIDSGWGYVPNPAGGFWGFWWNIKEFEGNNKVYLQIERGNLCFKIEVSEKSIRSRIRNEWCDIVIAKAQKENKEEIIRPKRPGYGNTMTVAIVSRKDWLGADDSRLNEEEIITVLKKYQSFLDGCIK